MITNEMTEIIYNNLRNFIIYVVKPRLAPQAVNIRPKNPWATSAHRAVVIRAKNFKRIFSMIVKTFNYSI